MQHPPCGRFGKYSASAVETGRATGSVARSTGTTVCWLSYSDTGTERRAPSGPKLNLTDGTEAIPPFARGSLSLTRESFPSQPPLARSANFEGLDQSVASLAGSATDQSRGKIPPGASAKPQHHYRCPAITNRGGFVLLGIAPIIQRRDLHSVDIANIEHRLGEKNSAKSARRGRRRLGIGKNRRG